MSGFGWLAIITVLVAGVYFITRPRRVPTKPTGGTVAPKPDAPLAAALGRFFGAFINENYWSEGGLSHFALGRREIGCAPFLTLRGLDEKRAVEVNVTAVHRETGEKMKVYIDGTGLDCSDRWTRETLLSIYPFHERPGDGKPTSCNPATQALYDAMFAATAKAQAELDRTYDPLPDAEPNLTPPTEALDTLPVEQGGCGASCTGEIVVSSATPPKGCHWIDWTFRFRLVDDKRVTSKWFQHTPVVLDVCNPASAATKGGDA